MKRAQDKSLVGAPVERIVARPDGYYWLADDGRQEFGPFEHLEAAEAAMRASTDSGLEATESLGELEAEVGVADWIDPDTGERADPLAPRTEDH